MRKVLIFKKGLKENLIEKGFDGFTPAEILGLLSSILEINLKNKKILFKTLLDAGVDCRESLAMACAYELGRRSIISNNPAKP